MTNMISIRTETSDDCSIFQLGERVRSFITLPTAILDERVFGQVPCGRTKEGPMTLKRDLSLFSFFDIHTRGPQRLSGKVPCGRNQAVSEVGAGARGR